MFLSDPDISYRSVREYRSDIFLPQQEHCKVYQRLNTLNHTETKQYFCILHSQRADINTLPHKESVLMYLKQMQFGSLVVLWLSKVHRSISTCISNHRDWHQTRCNQTRVTPDSDRSVHTWRKGSELLLRHIRINLTLTLQNYEPNIAMRMYVQSLKVSVNICYSILDIFNALDILSMQLFFIFLFLFGT